MKDVLILRTDMILHPSTIHLIREGIKNQIKEGVVFIPHDFKAELIHVPEDIEIVIEYKDMDGKVRKYESNKMD